MGKLIDLTGQRFGRLTVISQTDRRNTRGSIVWKCRCDCGKYVFVDGGPLKSGRTQSCGCLHRDNVLLNPPHKSHGGTRDRLYSIWSGMKDRCYRPLNSRYKDYGGRGIYVCEEWRHDYAEFRQWAMAAGYDPDAPRGQCTIDRIDVDGPYAPWNCRWVDMKAQEANKRKKV